MLSPMMQKAAGAVIACLSVVGAIMVFTGVNSKPYDDTFHAPVSDFFPILFLGGLLAVAGAKQWVCVLATSAALTYFPAFVATAYQIDKTETLTYGSVWGTFQQSKDYDELLDAGHFGNFLPGYSMLCGAIVVLGLALLRKPDAEATTFQAATEKVVLFGTAVLVCVLYVAGEAVATNKAGLSAEDYGTKPTADDVDFIVEDLMLVGLVFVAYALRTDASAWMALLALLSSMLFSKHVFAAATVAGVKAAVPDCLDSNDADICKQYSNQEAGHGLLACMCLLAMIGVATHAVVSHGGMQRKTELNKPCLVAALVAAFFALLACFGATTVYMLDGDDTIQPYQAVKNLQEWVGVSLLFAGLMVMASHVFQGALQSALRAFAIGLGFTAVTFAGGLIAAPEPFDNNGLCAQGDCTVAWGPVCGYIAAQLVALTFPCDIKEVGMRLIASVPGKVFTAFAVLGWILYLPVITYNFKDNDDSIYLLAATPLKLMGELVIAGGLFAAASREDAPRALRSVAVMLLSYVGFAAMQTLDELCNVDKTDTGLESNQKSMIAATLFTVIACAAAVFDLVSSGNWDADEGGTPGEGYAPMV